MIVVIAALPVLLVIVLVAKAMGALDDRRGPK